MNARSPNPRRTTASNRRSTTSDAIDVEKGTLGTSRVRAYARATSPARAGRTLLIIIPIAVARHSGPNGMPGATGSRITFHRSARMGKMIVAANVDQKKSHGSAREIGRAHV